MGFNEDEEFRRILASDKSKGTYKEYFKEEKNRKPEVANENLFFFTDQEYFSTTRFEYLSQKALSKGFIFGLFVPEQSLSSLSY